MHSKNDFNIENYIKALSTYIPASSMVKLKKAYKAFTFTKHPKSTILENRKLNDSFCILICGTIRHYTIDSNTAEEQTLRFTLSGNLLCQYGTATEATEYLSCLSECTILSVSNTILAEIGEETNLRIYCQNIIKENLELEVALLRMPPEKRYIKLCKQYQNIFLTVPLKYIASFLGITPQALCRIRKRLLITP